MGFASALFKVDFGSIDRADNLNSGADVLNVSANRSRVESRFKRLVKIPVKASSSQVAKASYRAGQEERRALHASKLAKEKQREQKALVSYANTVVSHAEASAATEEQLMEIWKRLGLAGIDHRTNVAAIQSHYKGHYDAATGSNIIDSLM